MINFSNISATSAASGFKNYNLDAATTVATIPAQTLNFGDVVSVSASISLDNTEAVSLLKIQYATFDDFWRQMMGFVASDLIASEYSLQSNSYYLNGNLVVDTYAVNQTLGSISLPEQTINIRARLYRSPFG